MGDHTYNHGRCTQPACAGRRYSSLAAAAAQAIARLWQRSHGSSFFSLLVSFSTDLSHSSRGRLQEYARLTNRHRVIDKGGVGEAPHGCKSENNAAG